MASAAAGAPGKLTYEQMKDKFIELCKQDIESQVEFFLKSFIFALGDEWKEVLRLSGEFKKYCRDGGEGRMDLNPVQASDFLQVSIQIFPVHDCLFCSNMRKWID